MEIRALERRDREQLERLLAESAFDDYGAYRFVAGERLKEFRLDRLMGLSREKDAHAFIAAGKTGVAGLLVLRLLRWDSRHFGRKAAQIEHFIVTGDARYGAVVRDSLLKRCMASCREEGYIFVSARIDTRDILSVHSLERHGFNIMDTLVTYSFNRHKHGVPLLKDMCRIRQFRQKDLPALVRIAAGVFSKDRFHLDAHISLQEADSLFGKWVKGACKAGDKSRLFVAERRDVPVGFLTFGLDAEFAKHSGHRICGHGLSAVSAGQKGIYPALVKAAIQDIARQYDCLEFDTQLNNYEVVRVWQKFGFDLTRTKYTFHKWLEAAAYA